MGEIGKLLQEATANASLSQTLKDQFGGLKKFLEKVTDLRNPKCTATRVEAVLTQLAIDHHVHASYCNYVTAAITSMDVSCNSIAVNLSRHRAVYLACECVRLNDESFELYVLQSLIISSSCPVLSIVGDVFAGFMILLLRNTRWTT